MLSVKEALGSVMDRVGALGGERVELDEGLGRVLAEDGVARRGLPPRDNSAMDGWAVRFADVGEGGLRVGGEVAAGASGEMRHAVGTATRIMTGAPMPEGADTVVIRENAEVRGGEVFFSGQARLGQNVRKAGEDVAAGTIAIEKGTRLGAGEIGLLAALGYPTIAVGKQPRVSVLSTGSELVDVTDNPPKDRIINSNAHALAAQIREAGGVPDRRPIVADDKQAIIDAIANGLANADVLITSGGVSVGDYDFVKEALTANEVDVAFWKIAVKPGKPVVFGTAPNGALVFGLPGNPVSSMVSFELFVRPALLAMAGASRTARRRASCHIETAYQKAPGRTHYLRATLEHHGTDLHAIPFKKQGSGMLSSMTSVDALIEIDADKTEVRAGDQVEVIILRHG